MTFELDPFKQAYANFNQRDLAPLLAFYHEQVEFADPVHTILGKSALTTYFEKVSRGVQECRFVFESQVVAGNEVFVTWTMTFRHHRLQRGRPISIVGASQLRLQDGLIVYHRDFYDLGAMLYEQVPVLGCVVKSIKNRLKH